MSGVDLGISDDLASVSAFFRQYFVQWCGCLPISRWFTAVERLVCLADGSPLLILVVRRLRAEADRVVLCREHAPCHDLSPSI